MSYDGNSFEARKGKLAEADVERLLSNYSSKKRNEGSGIDGYLGEQSVDVKFTEPFNVIGQKNTNNTFNITIFDYIIIKQKDRQGGAYKIRYPLTPGCICELVLFCYYERGEVKRICKVRTEDLCKLINLAMMNLNKLLIQQGERYSTEWRYTIDGIDFYQTSNSRAARFPQSLITHEILWQK